MSRLRNDNRILIVLTLAVVALLLSIVGCERKIVGDVQVDETVSDQCFNCHNGQLDVMQGEWANSVHASGANVDYTSRDGSDCTRCHNQEGFLTWINTGTILATTGNAKAIGCFACHNPHENGDMRLRTEAPVTLVGGDVFNNGKANICANCHQSRSGPDVIAAGDSLEIRSTRYGPHNGPQSDLVNGSTGYEGFGGIWSTAHATVVPNACLGCHMVYSNTHEGYDVGGHSWNMEDEAGNNIAANCTQANCHGSGALEFTASTNPGHPYDFKLKNGAQDWDNDGVINGYQTEFEGMLDSVLNLLVAQGIATTSGSSVRGWYFDEGLVGAMYNFKMLAADRSEGMHNFGYAQSLLQGSWDYLKTLPPPTTSVSPIVADTK